MTRRLTTCLLLSLLTACSGEAPPAPGAASPAATPPGPGAASAAAEAPASLASGIELEYFDTRVAPGDDFYRYVNGIWLANTPIPADKSNYGVFTVLDDEAREQLRALIEDAA